MHLAPLLVREIDRRQCRPDPTRREGAGVAGAEPVGPILEPPQTMLADAPAHIAVLVPDRRGLDAQPLPERLTVTRCGLRDAHHAVQRPAQVPRGGPRGSQQSGELLDVLYEVR